MLNREIENERPKGLPTIGFGWKTIYLLLYPSMGNVFQYEEEKKIQPDVHTLMY